MLLQTCLKDKFDLTDLKKKWNPDLAVPLVNATLGLKNIIDHADDPEFISVDPQSGLISFVYSGELLSFDPWSILQLPDQNLKFSTALSSAEINELKFSGSVQKSGKEGFTYKVSDEVQLDSIQIRNGKIKLNVSNTLPCKGNLKIIFPWLVKNRQAYQLSIPFTGSGQLLSLEIDLSEYSIILSQGPGDYNKFEIQYELSLKYSNEFLSPAQGITLSLSTHDWKFKGVFGYFGNPRVALDTDSVLLNIFNTASGAYFALPNPKVKLIIDNSFGFPVQVNFNELKSASVKSGIVTPIMLTSFQNPFEILAPSIREVGKSKQSVLEINRSNSNLDSLITPAPQYMIYGMEAIGNVNHPPSPVNRNFMTDQSSFKISTDLELPLEGFAYGFSLVDTSSFSFKEDKPQEIDSVLLKISFENTLPIDLKMQLLFLDENKQPVDSLLPLSMNYIIKSGYPNREGKITMPSSHTTEVVYNQRRVNNLKKSRYIVIRGSTNTWQASSSNPDNRVIKIYDHYGLSVKVGMIVSARPAGGK